MEGVIATHKHDPLGEIDGLSLIGSRFPSLPHDHLAYHLFLQSLPVKNTDVLVEEGNEILKVSLESVLETLDNEPRNSLPGVHGVRGDLERCPSEDVYKENANICSRFGSNRSLEELNSLPVVMGKITEVPIDFDKIMDPHELFEAFERRKRAQKELARLTGCPIPKFQRIARPRRHSKVYDYKHWYPSKDSPKRQQEKNENSNASDIVQDGICESIIKLGSGVQSACLVDALIESTRKKSLDDLVESKVKNFEEGELNPLLEQLKLKPFEAEKLNILEMPEIRRMLVDDAGAVPNKISRPLSDSQYKFHNTGRRKRKSFDIVSKDSPTPPRSPSEPLSVLRRGMMKVVVAQNSEIHKIQKNLVVDAGAVPNEKSNTLSDVRNEFQDIRRKRKSFDLGSSYSPTLLRSPFASLFVLGKSISKKSPISNPFDFSEVENSSLENASQGEKNCEVNSENIGSVRNLELSPPRQSKSSSPRKNLMNDLALEKKNSTLPCLVVDDLCSVKHQENKECSSPAGSGLIEVNFLEEPKEGERENESFDFGVTDGNSSERIETSELSFMEAFVDGNFLAAAGHGSSSTDHEIDNGKPQKKNKKRKKRVAISRTLKGKSVASDHSYEASQSVSGNDLEKNRQSSTSSPKSNNIPSQKELHVPEESQPMSPNNLRERQNKRATQMRNSLAGAGTCFQSGTRRSTRIKSKPLQYWKGERFLYGRVHESLITVIGIKKFDSPGNSKLKVESFVSDKYSDLVESAAIG